MSVEIERKFLCVPPEGLLEGAPSAFLRQGYLVVGGDGEVRLRAADGIHTLTVKSSGGLTRQEYEVTLDLEQFEQLWPATQGRRIEKRRYRVVQHETLLEIDVYETTLSGLIVCEAEFASVEDAAEFSAPDWCGSEVTDDPRFKNAALALEGMPIPPTGT